jgi:predicted CopG family antitoxin
VHDKCTAVKTITIDLVAYEALSRRKLDGQSFSDVIKAHFGAGGTARDLLRAAAMAGVEADTLDQVADVVKRRRRDRARAPAL